VNSLRPRRRVLLLSLFVAAGLAGLASNAAAEAPSAPIPVQAQITARILPFERGFAGRAAGAVHIVIAERPGNADSTSAARLMHKALADIDSIAGMKIKISTIGYTGAAALAAECKRQGAVAVYLTPGMAGDVRAVADALGGSGVLSVAAVESYVPDGAVLGVEIVSGKPRMSINLGRAKAQKLDFPSALLKLARIY
jgi:hypothetical protein